MHDCVALEKKHFHVANAIKEAFWTHPKPPDDVVISSGIETPGVFVELVWAHVFLHNVIRRALLDIHALVTVGGDCISSYEVTDTFVWRIIHPLQGQPKSCRNSLGMGRQMWRNENGALIKVEKVGDLEIGGSRYRNVITHLIASRRGSKYYRSHEPSFQGLRESALTGRCRILT